MAARLLHCPDVTGTLLPTHGPELHPPSNHLSLNWVSQTLLQGGDNPSRAQRAAVTTGAIRRVRRGRRGSTEPVQRGVQEDVSRDNQGSSSAPPLGPGQSWQEDLMNEWRHSLHQDAQGELSRSQTEDSSSLYPPESSASAGQGDDDFADLDAQTVQEAKRTVADLIRAGDSIEEEIRRLGRQGKLTTVVLLVVKNRFKFAIDDNEREVAQCMDLLYRRIRAEMDAREATPAMRLLNELLHLKDESRSSHQDWVQECRQLMKDSFLPENDPFSLIVPRGYDPAQVTGPMSLDGEDDGLLLRIDFIREVDELLEQVEADLLPVIEQLDLSPEHVALRLQVEERLRTVAQVRELREVAALLKL